jgi:hypothetical protein
MLNFSFGAIGFNGVRIESMDGRMSSVIRFSRFWTGFTGLGAGEWSDSIMKTSPISEPCSSSIK